MKRQYLSVCMTFMSVLALTGCTSLKTEMIDAMNNHQANLKVTVAEESYSTERVQTDWIPLDKLKNYSNLRKTWDDSLNVVKHGEESKNGPMYIDLNGNQFGNNTMFNAFQNKVFVNDYWGNGKIRTILSDVAKDEFKDITGESTGMMASLNTYFNILPVNKDKTSGMLNYLTRAEVMQAIYRGDTPVKNITENKDFTNAVGDSVYNINAQEVADLSYLDYRNGGLNEITYNTTMTRAEAVYMIVKKIYAQEYDEVVVSDAGFTDCKNAGRVADKKEFTDGYAWQLFELEWCLQNRNSGLTEDLYKALVVAKNHDIITATTRWYQGIQGRELIMMLMDAYNNLYTGNNFLVNAKVGKTDNVTEENISEENTSDNSETAESTKTEQEENADDSGDFENILGDIGVQQIANITDIDKLIETYGTEINMTEDEIVEAKESANGYTIELVDKYMIVDNCDYLKAYKGPNNEFNSIKSVKKGTQVHVVGKCIETGWFRIIADGKIVYQEEKYFLE